ncbi:MAG: hypothetical protein EOP04_16340, partial [Proteobacteria bacterium]
PFGMTMAAISSKAAQSGQRQNRLKYNGMEEETEEFHDRSGLELYDFYARRYDSQIGRFVSFDPHSESYVSVAPNVYCFNNPIVASDPTGCDPSTHTDAEGNVLAVFDDGDLGVYRHENAKTYGDIVREYGKAQVTNGNTDRSGGGEKMGETLFWDEFLSSHNSPTTGQREPTNSAGNQTYKINFGESWDRILGSKISEAMRMLPWDVAQESKNNGTFSLQDQPELTAQGRLFQGKYFSTESMGNYLAGYNAHQAGMPTFDGFQRIAGALELQTHGRPSIKLGSWEMFQLAVGLKSFGTHPLHGELMQQYRMSKMGWDAYKSPKFSGHVVK